MAPDLIPPPSPAGRPPPDSGDAEDRAGAALAQAAPGPRRPEPATGPSPFRSRFGFLWGALIGVAVCVGAVTVGLAATAGDNSGPALAKHWSTWKPSTSRMIDGAADIAARVGREYKLDSGDQLVAVRSGAIEVSGTPLGVAVRPKGGQLETLEGDGLLYVLSGLGPDGRLNGKATRERGRLLMREALELSLYSFRYLDDVTMVAVMLPPAGNDGSKPSTTANSSQARALFYRPGDLLGELQVPLARTLSAKTPTPKTIAKPEAARIDSLALRNLFLATVQQLDSDLSYLVLVEPDTVS
jgi:hypothetical protein